MALNFSNLSAAIDNALNVVKNAASPAELAAIKQQLADAVAQAQADQVTIDQLTSKINDNLPKP